MIDRFILSIPYKSLLPGAPAKNEPQINADERRFVVPEVYRRGKGSLLALGKRGTPVEREGEGDISGIKEGQGNRG